jgi:hypothetical protein
VTAAVDDHSALVMPAFGSCRHAKAVTPSDTVDLSNVSRFLFVGTSTAGAGTVTVIMQDGTTALFKNLLQGTLLPVCATRVKSTGTTASDLVALW